MIWPPIRYSYDTHNLDLPTPAPSKPTWLLTEAECKIGARAQAPGELQQPRIQLARHRRPGPRCAGAPDLRLPRLGIVRPHPHHLLFDRRRRGGRRAGLFRRLDRSVCSSASSKSGPRCRSFICSSSYPSVLVPGFFVLLGILLMFSWVRLVGLVRAEFLRGRNFRIYPGGARARRIKRRDHVPSPVAQRHGGDDDVSAVHHVVVGD